MPESKRFKTTNLKNWVEHEFEDLGIHLELHSPKPGSLDIYSYFAMTWRCDFRGAEGLRVIVDTYRKLRQTYPFPPNIEEIMDAIREEKDDHITDFEPIWANFGNKEANDVIELAGLSPDTYAEDLAILDDQMGSNIPWIRVSTPFVEFYYDPATDEKPGSFGLIGMHCIPNETVEIFMRTSPAAKGADLEGLRVDIETLTQHLGRLGV